ncbi:MAG: FecR domain-containing protein [Pirellulales bacterium]|nr:FecR domain-containing protein [Pirellulales bacterium]
MDQYTLDDLLMRWMSGELSPEEFAALEGVLESDAGARRRLRQHAMLDTALRELPGIDLLPPGGFPRLDLPWWVPWGGSGVPIWLLTAAVIIVGGAAWWLGRGGAPAAAPQHIASASNSSDVPHLPAVKTLETNPHFVKLSLDRIGTVIMDGSADFCLVGPLRARLNHGRIKVRISEESGHGFVVETPDGEVTDLGTEFGVDVVPGKQSGVVVFEGTVDLRVTNNQAASRQRVERLVSGEGVTFAHGGPILRIPCVVTGSDMTFRFNGKEQSNQAGPVIVGVSDNLSPSKTRRFYEVVPGGFGEDVLAYGDRPKHEWNGVMQTGMPKFLIGADYVKTFSDDELRKDMKIQLRFSRPAKLYIFYDRKQQPPDWLRADFQKINQVIGMDLGEWHEIGRPVENAVGPGKNIDHVFNIWERTVESPGTVTLGANITTGIELSKYPYMYGIAAVALDSAKTRQTEKLPQQQ